ncbi:MAG: hypothetical protein IPK82_35305 [Polyangiaceae bacterium]|nr:hypothetical protein [Polyangiaceae bacterium]
MRSRPDLQVYFRPGVPIPGRTFQVDARFESKSETPVDGVSIELLGTELVRVPRGKSEARHMRTHVHLRSEQPGKVFSPGTHVYSAMFQLPANLPPRHAGRYTVIDYTVEVRASIPWWPDAVRKYDVPVGRIPENPATAPGVFVSRKGGPAAGELYAELSLASTVVAPAGHVVGTVALMNASKERGVRISLVGYEHVFVNADFWAGGNIDEMREVYRYNFAPQGSKPREGEAIPFRFAVPPTIPASFTAQMSSLIWVVEVSTERLLSWREMLRVPITIVPSLGARGEAPALVPAVGRARRSQSFQAIAERLGLVYDAAAEQMHTRIGQVHLLIAVEARADGNLATVATISWPALGMNFRVAPSSWTDAFSRAEIEVGIEHFDKKFHVESRFVEQARAFLDAAFCDLILGFDEASGSDDNLSLLVNVALSDAEALASFTDRAVRAAALANAALGRIPPPPAFEPHENNWKVYTEKLGGRYEAGRPAIVDGTLGLERVSLATEWTSDNQPAATEIRVDIGTRIDPAAISPAAHTAKEALELTGQPVLITEDAVILRVVPAVTDPQAIEPTIESLVRLSHLVRGRGAAGPFRS